MERGGTDSDRCTPGGIGHAIALKFHEKGTSEPIFYSPLLPFTYFYPPFWGAVCEMRADESQAFM